MWNSCVTNWILYKTTDVHYLMEVRCFYLWAQFGGHLFFSIFLSRCWVIEGAAGCFLIWENLASICFWSRIWVTIREEFCSKLCSHCESNSWSRWLQLLSRKNALHIRNINSKIAPYFVCLNFTIYFRTFGERTS